MSARAWLREGAVSAEPNMYDIKLDSMNICLHKANGRLGGSEFSLTEKSRKRDGN